MSVYYMEIQFPPVIERVIGTVIEKFSPESVPHI